jgi:carbon monoxide dehydrogenase subunit G
VRVDERVVVPLGLDAAWDFVWQVDRLAACVPGCTGAQVVEPGRRYAAQVADRIGPYKVEVDLDVVVQDAEPQRSIHALISGRDRRLGTTQRVDLTVELAALGANETAIDVGAEVEVLGKIASLGQFAIKRKVKDIVAKFGQNVRAACQAQSPSPSAGGNR